jgi:hypothetical protein
VVEKEIETWYKTDPDPFDDRHPGRSDPECGLGNMLKIIFKNENLMNKVFIFNFYTNIFVFTCTFCIFCNSFVDRFVFNVVFSWSTRI